MVKRQSLQTSPHGRDLQTRRNGSPAPRRGGPIKPWRQWHSSVQTPEAPPLEVAQPRKPQWGRFIYLGIIGIVAALVLREIYGGLFWYNAQGSVSGRQYSVSPSQTVTIEDILIEPSQQVTAGQPLVKLNSPELVQSLARNEAEIARLQADLVESTSRIETTREQLRAQIASQQAEMESLEDRSRTEIERINALRRLVAAGAASRGSLQDIEMQHSETWSEYQRVKAELQSAYRQSKTLAESGQPVNGSAPPENRLSSLTQLRDSLKSQLSALELRAPSDGVVATVAVSRGDVLTAGEPAVVMVEPEHTKAFLYFPPSAQGKLQVGQVVPARTSAGEHLPLRIEKIYPRMESKSAQQHSQLNAPEEASLVAEASPVNGAEFPASINSGTPIYGRVPRWSFAEDIEAGVAQVKQFFGEQSPAVTTDAKQLSMTP